MIYSIVLAAGKGTRMKTDKPKVCHQILGFEMINLVLENLNHAGVTKNIVVVGHKAEEVKEVIAWDNFEIVKQEKQLGTANAIEEARPKLDSYEGTTIIICGDTPLITDHTIKKAIQYHEDNQAGVTVLAASVKKPNGYGRIIEKNNKFIKIVEEKDATDEEKAVNKVNSGAYIIDNQLLWKYIGQIDNKNESNEYYFTDIIEIMKNNKEVVTAYEIDNNYEILGVNDPSDLAEAAHQLKIQINNKHLRAGVIIVDPYNTYIEPQVKIGSGTEVMPNVYLKGNTVIGSNNKITLGSYINNSRIGNDNTIDNSKLVDTCIGNHNYIGPNAHTRDNAIIHNKTRIGNFVEIKNSEIFDQVKTAHLVYLGDAVVHKNTNIGCGVITVNYDGISKHKTFIGENSFIGSNVNLIAPITVGKNVFIAAGSTINKGEIPDDKLVISRSREMKVKDLKNS